MKQKCSPEHDKEMQDIVSSISGAKLRSIFYAGGIAGEECALFVADARLYAVVKPDRLRPWPINSTWIYAGEMGDYVVYYFNAP